MNYKYTFFDNQLIGVDQLNEITSRLVSGGISAAYSGADFDVYEINNSNKAILCGGVVPEKDSNLKVTALGTGRYLINQGLCFFDDGTSMEILSGGEEIGVPLGAEKYVYLVSDKNQMKCYVETADSPRQSGVFQLLAFIDKEGNISDRRKYAKGKVEGFYSSSDHKEVNISETYYSGDITSGQTLEIDVGNGNFHHLCIKIEGEFHSSAGYNVNNGGLFYCDFENGIAVNPVSCAAVYGDSYLFYDKSLGECVIDKNVKLQNGRLLVNLQRCVVQSGRSVTFCYHLW